MGEEDYVRLYTDRGRADRDPDPLAGRGLPRGCAATSRETASTGSSTTTRKSVGSSCRCSAGIRAVDARPHRSRGQSLTEDDFFARLMGESQGRGRWSLSTAGPSLEVLSVTRCSGSGRLVRPPRSPCSGGPRRRRGLPRADEACEEPAARSSRRRSSATSRASPSSPGSTASRTTRCSPTTRRPRATRILCAWPSWRAGQASSNAALAAERLQAHLEGRATVRLGRGRQVEVLRLPPHTVNAVPPGRVRDQPEPRSAGPTRLRSASRALHAG